MSIESTCNVGATALSLTRDGDEWLVKVGGLRPQRFPDFKAAQDEYLKQIAFIFKYLA